MPLSSTFELVSVIIMGFLLGMRHATDADHVVAVSTIVARNKSFGRAWVLGAFWGLGHTVTIFVVGLGIIAYRVRISPRLGLSMEFAVGLMLVILGLMNLSRGGVRPPVKGKAGNHSHSAPVQAILSRLNRVKRGVGLGQILKASMVGLIHGLAGSAAVSLLILSMIPSPRAALLYLVLFGLGTLAGMLSLSAAMEFSMVHAVRRWGGFERVLAGGTGLLSLCFGLYILYQVGFIDGLFLANPSWTPR